MAPKKRAAERSRRHDRPSSASAADAWEQFTSPDGRVYYYNQVTQESRWKLPKELRKKTPSDGEAATTTEKASDDPPSRAARDRAPTAAVAQAVEAFAAAGAKQQPQPQSQPQKKKSELFERLQASLAGRIHPTAPLVGGQPPPMLRLPREEEPAVPAEQQVEVEETHDEETAHMTAAERLRFLRKKRQASMFATQKIAEGDDFMKEFARNMEKKTGQQQLPVDARANFDWRKKREDEQAAREKEEALERQRRHEQEEQKRREEEEVLERQRRQEREEQKRREEEEENEKRRREEEAERKRVEKVEAKKQQEQKARADEERRRKEAEEEEKEARKRAEATAVAIENPDDGESDHDDHAHGSEQEALELLPAANGIADNGSNATTEPLFRDNTARIVDNDSSATAEPTATLGGAGDDDGTAIQAVLGVERDGNTEEVDGDEQERRRMKEERRVRRRAAKLEAAKVQQEPSMSPVKPKKLRAKAAEGEDREQQEVPTPSQSHHQHHPHQHHPHQHHPHQHHQYPPLSDTSLESASPPQSMMESEGDTCACCRSHSLAAPMHYPPPPPFPMYYPYAPPPPPPPMVMMVMPPYAPPPPPPVLYPPPQQQLPGMIPTAIVPFANNQVALYGGYGSGAMGARPVVDRCEGCQGRGVGLVEKNGFCNHCNRLRLDFIVASTRIRQRCSVCGGWGLGLVQTSTGKCDHCSRVGHKPLAGAVATPLAQQQQLPRQPSRSASNGAAKRVGFTNGFREQRTESIEWDDDDDDDDDSDWDA